LRRGFALDATPPEVDFPVLYIYEIHVERAWRGTGLGSFLLQEALSTAREADISTVLLTRWARVGSTLNTSPTNKDFYRAHKFYPTSLARRREEYSIWRRDL
tara:strand:+ start:164 stop:469 length:306 start_codon:yes stop_codon:yes gene_type:complete